MNRTSGANSSSSSFKTTETDSSNLNCLSPLIKLERLIFRLNPLLSLKVDELTNDFEVKKQLKLLLQVNYRESL